MKKTGSAILWAVISLCSLPALQAQGNFDIDLEEIVCKERNHAHSDHAANHSRNETAAATDIHYQIMRWEINPAEKYVTGEITYYFTSNVDGLQYLTLDLTKALQVNDVNRQGNTLIFSHTDDQLLTIQLDKALAIGEADTITIDYEGVPPSNGLGSFEQTEHAGAPIIWTLSEPYGVRDWWPAKQDLIDKIDSVDIYITTPKDNLAASNGKLMSIADNGNQLTHHWRHRHPIASYLIALAVTNYEAYSDYVHMDTGDSIEILNYVYPESLQNAKDNTPVSIEIMSLYNELFGTYPFADEKYGHAQFGWGGGMEHQTMSFMYNYTYNLIAHEMAHQWFGNKVTCGSWSDIWLNEGFATYLTGLAMERYSHDLYWPIWKTQTSNSATSQPGGSVYVTDTTDVNRIFSGRLTYNKGAYVLHMLRWVVGDNAFFAGCRNYLNMQGTAFDFARTSELQDHLEQTSGLSLGEFLDDWFYGEGYPSYSIDWYQMQDSLILLVSQTPSHPSVSFFEMPIPIHIYQQGESEEIVVSHTSNHQRFGLYVGDVVIDSLQFDPERWILSRDNVIQHLTVSTDNPDSQHSIQIFPNPADDVLEFRTTSVIESVVLINTQGVMHALSIENNRVNISSIPDGMYYLKMQLHDQDIPVYRRIVKVSGQ